MSRAAETTETREPTARMIEAYESGRKHQDSRDLMALSYADPVVTEYWLDRVLHLFWEAGHEDKPMPKWATGERYGDVPEVSFNHRDDRCEPGVSLARLDDESDEYDWYMGETAYTRPVVRVAGWLHFRRGSDGEPLLVGAKVIA